MSDCVYLAGTFSSELGVFYDAACIAWQNGKMFIGYLAQVHCLHVSLSKCLAVIL